jgi:endonuclease/exonuclease/phosphatase family metal-dependent hydrolase
VDNGTITVVTWNLLGSTGLDVAGVAGVLRAADPDVIVLQEVGRGHAGALAGTLGMAQRWAFKHLTWPHAEGMAVLTPHRIVRSTRFLIRRAPFWHWRRRVALTVELERTGERFAVINVHLSAHDEGASHRRREAAEVLAAARRLPGLAVVAGDCNDEAGGAGPSELAAEGWIDAWAAAGTGDGATNWTPGERHGRLPTQRLDYVFAPPGGTVANCTVLASTDRLDWFADRSDHLPVSAVLRPPGGEVA